MRFAPAVYQGDCVTKLAEIEQGSIQLAFADPPFNIGYKYDVYDDRQGYEQYLAWSRQWMQGVVRALSPTGAFWLAIGDEYAAELKLIAQNELRLTCRSWVIWYYTFGVNCTQKFNRSHVHLFHFVKDGRLGRFTFNAADPAVRVPSARQLVYADGRANPDGRLPDDTWILRPQDVPSGFGADQDTWYFPRVAGTFKERAGFHGCQMPEQLLGRIIRISSNEGDWVLDPFAGSGTTLVVAKKLNRKFLGFELSKDYAAKVRARLESVKVGQRLDGADEPLRSAPATPRSKAIDFKTGIIEAFLSARAGHAADHVLANPDLNSDFLDACRRRSLPGQDVDWNRYLLRLRKAKELPKVEVVRTRKFTRVQMDAYSFAGEIALQEMTSRTHLSLDEIFCDPALATTFDELARSYCPGHTSFEYRWAALAIRKRAKDARHAFAEFKAEIEATSLQRAKSWVAILKSAGFSAPGTYVLKSDDGRSVYVGKTLNLESMLRTQYELQDRPVWSRWRVKGVHMVKVPDWVGAGRRRDQREKLASRFATGLQSDLISKMKPVLNYPELSAEST